MDNIGLRGCGPLFVLDKPAAFRLYVALLTSRVRREDVLCALVFLQEHVALLQS